MSSDPPNHRERRRMPIGDSLGIAQTNRSTARGTWIDLLWDTLIVIHAQLTPKRRAKVHELYEAQRLVLHVGSDEYAERLADADRALIDRVSVMLLNEQILREQHFEQLEKRLAAIEAANELSRTP